MAKSYPTLSQATAHVPFDAVADPRKAFTLVDDFVTDTGPFATSGNGEDGAPGIVSLDDTGVSLDSDLYVGGTEAVSFTIRARCDAATGEVTLNVGGASVHIDVGDAIAVTDGTTSLDTDVVVEEDEWYTVQFVITSSDMGVRVNGGYWFVIEDHDLTAGALTVSVVGEAGSGNSVDFVEIHQRTDRAGYTAQ